MSVVSEIMTRNPACCTPETSLVEAAELMVSFDCGEIPVINSYLDKKVIGILTDRDICVRIVAQNLNPKNFKVEDCMTKPAIALEESTSIEDCCRIMQENQIRRIPVVDEEGACVGIVSLADIVKYTPDELMNSLVKNLSRPSSDSPIFVS